ncbi:MAG TPA: prepilin-type N-terminal cleavage/methylation domain-containing protein [Kiritimatiellia bacterium]|nr:prepilin-type N-terminal cleavage/methylation domain-containing protein [Kiritimatiellia bacterium]
MTEKFRVPDSKFQEKKEKSIFSRPGTWNLKRGTRRGFTLIEVMMALAILGIGLSVLIATASKCLAVVKQSKNYEAARHLLGIVELEHRNQILKDEEVVEGTGSATFKDAPDGFKGTWEVVKIEDPSAEDGEEARFFQVTYRVSWSERGMTPYEEVVTYMYVKPEGGSFERTPQ